MPVSGGPRVDGAARAVPDNFLYIHGTGGGRLVHNQYRVGMFLIERQKTAREPENSRAVC